MVNRALLVVVAAQAATGIAGLLTGQPLLRGVFDLHRVLAILFLLLLAFKVPVVWHALAKGRRNRLAGLSLLLGGLILSANAIGWLVAAGLLPLRLPIGVTWLSVHVYLPATWRLTLTGRIDSSLSLGYDDLALHSNLVATLDCTSGWFTEQEWTGLPVEPYFAALAQ